MISKNNIFKSGTTLVVSLFLFCSAIIGQTIKPAEGRWIGVMRLNDTMINPLQLDFELNAIDGKWNMVIKNASERIVVDEITMKTDSLFMKMPVFDSEFKCAVELEGKKLTGVWINHARKNNNIVPFEAYICEQACKDEVDAIYQDFPAVGIWECEFSPGTKNASKAKGIFSQPDPTKHPVGTFLTETGDYRFLSGHDGGDRFSMSCFDGSHAFYFEGTIKGDSIVNGKFISGAHWQEPWVAKRNDKFQLRNPDSLTYLKPGFTKVDFNFKNLEGKNVSLQDEKFKNKVVIIQIMGSWCPNCMDETKFLAPFYDKYNSKGLEVVALAFERTDDFNKAVSNIQRSKTRFNAKYEFLITMKTGKDQASEALPMLNEVMAFPTTIYIDKKGVVRKIYTGFNGPATGDAHTKFVEDTTRFVEKLLAE